MLNLSLKLPFSGYLIGVVAASAMLVSADALYADIVTGDNSAATISGESAFPGLSETSESSTPSGINGSTDASDIALVQSCCLDSDGNRSSSIPEPLVFPFMIFCMLGLGLFRISRSDSGTTSTC